MATRHALPVLLLLLTALLFAPSASASGIVVNDGTCTGVQVDDEFTGYCLAPCLCPGYPCQDWYAHGLYLFHACWA